jgi:Rnl2 family RNA ligase
MNNFKRYKSIENHYREKHIMDMLDHNPIYNCCSYIATEKIHGANFQINFHLEDTKAVSVGYGKRSGFITEGEKFYNHHGTLDRPEYQELIERVCKHMRTYRLNDIILYGEFAGPGVQSGVEYGDKKFVMFFDMWIDGEYITPREFYLIMSHLEASHMTVPAVGKFNTLKEALEFEVEGKESVVFPKEGNTWEGVVIKPWDTIARNKDGDQVLFYIKKKDSKFKDRQSKSKDRRKDLPQELLDAQHAFSEYLTETRLQDVFSKHGPIESDKQVGEYIKYMMEDAKEDFFKDCMELFNAVDDKNKGKVFSIAGKVVAPMLMKLV